MTGRQEPVHDTGRARTRTSLVQVSRGYDAARRRWEITVVMPSPRIETP
jgi:hypothetical protein